MPLASQVFKEAFPLYIPYSRSVFFVFLCQALCRRLPCMQIVCISTHIHLSTVSTKRQISSVDWEDEIKKYHFFFFFFLQNTRNECQVHFFQNSLPSSLQKQGSFYTQNSLQLKKHLKTNRFHHFTFSFKVVM